MTIPDVQPADVNHDDKLDIDLLQQVEEEDSSPLKQQQQSSPAMDEEEAMTRERQRTLIGLDRQEAANDLKDFACCMLFFYKRERCFRCLTRWPRVCAFVFGVTIPLWFLIAMSLFLGYYLSKVEAPNEVTGNDEFMAVQAQETILKYLIGNFTRIIPWACWSLYLQNNRTVSDAEMYQQLLNVSLNFNLTVLDDDFIDGLNTNELIVINTTDMYLFMRDCGNQAAPVVSEMLQIVRNISLEAPQLTFNWIRCIPSAIGQGLHGEMTTGFNVDMRPEAQAEFYAQVWNQSRTEILGNLTPPDGFKTLKEKLEAQQQAILEATGESGCVFNGAASAWFWFTVMTTVGYGNQAPETTAGRTMVYTLGFLSILAFAGILARAGQIINAIFDDAFVRARLRCFASPLVASLIWGCAYYSWMLIIAQQTQTWKIERLGEPFSFRNAYWFSYISTATIGLGDIFLEPEVFIARDLLVFPSLFLIGFTLLSAFLGKFAIFVLSATKSYDKTTMVQVLLDQLKKLPDETAADNKEMDHTPPTEESPTLENGD